MFFGTLLPFWWFHESEVTQSCPTVCDPMECSLPGSSVHGIFQSIVLEWIAISFSRGSSWPRDWTWVSCIIETLYRLSHQGSPDDPRDVDNLISGSSAFCKTRLNIWKFTVHVLLKPHLENFEHYFASMWDECNCLVVWIFFGIAFLWDRNENWPFPVLWPLLSFTNLLANWVQHFHSTMI